MPSSKTFPLPFGISARGAMFPSDEWTGRTGDVWADEWRRTDRSFAGLNSRLNAAILAAAPDAGDAIDLGCGAGETSIALATARPGLKVVGLDISPGLIDVARARGAGIANLAFRVADTAQIDSGSRANLLVSRHGVMFFADPVAAFSAIRNAAMPGARLVFSCFRSRGDNSWALLGGALIGAPPPPPPGYMPGPFGFADQGFVADLLGRSGWTAAGAEAVDFNYVAGAGDDAVADATDFFVRIGPIARTIAERPPAERPALIDRLAGLVGQHLNDGVVTFPAATWIWTATAGDTA